MSNSTRWMAYERRGVRGRKNTIIVPDNEPAPRHFSLRGDATEQEVSEELHRRKQDEEQKVRRRLFESRPEVGHARSIASYIENNLEQVIDRLKPDEWAWFLKRLQE